MPFVSRAQQKWMWANEPAMAADWQKETPKGKKLPARVKKSFYEGIADAYDRFGFKTAAEEIRLQLPRREFHGFEESFRKENRRNTKKAEEEDAPIIADLLTHIEHIDGVPIADPNPVADHEDSNPLWSSAGDPPGGTGGQMSGVRPAEPVGGMR